MKRRRELIAPRSWVLAMIFLLSSLLIGATIAPVASASASASASAADPITAAATALSTSSLYVGDPSAVISNRAVVDGALDSKIKIAILPAGSGNALAIARQIGSMLDPAGNTAVTVGVVTGRLFAAASSRFREGYAEDQASAAVQTNARQLTGGGDHPDLTALIQDFASRVRSGPPLTSGRGDLASSGSDSEAGVWIVVAVLVVVVAGLIAGLAGLTRRRRRRDLAVARRKVETYYDRLASELSNLDPEDVGRARLALDDAAERFTSAGSLLAEADSVEEYAQAQHTTLEGLYAARTVREETGAAPGAELPMIAQPRGEQLSGPRIIDMQGQLFQGYPNYTPGAPHFYGGGGGIPGGWYSTPFWDALLIGGVLSEGWDDGGSSGSGTQ